MKVREALAWGTEARARGPRAWRGGDDASPFLDASLLLAHALGVSRDHLLSLWPDAADESALGTYRRLVEARAAGTPVAYLLGRREFFGRDFLCDARALIPRPDTEILVEAALDYLDSMPRGARVHDACTGTGCVALSLALAIIVVQPFGVYNKSEILGVRYGA